MIDGIIKNDGTSRLIRSVADFKSKYPTYDDFATALVAGTLPLDILFNSGGWSQKPDFLNKANLLADSTAAMFADLPENPTPDDVFRILGNAALDPGDGTLLTPSGNPAGMQAVSGHYIGTGVYGQSNPTTLSFSFKVKVLFIIVSSFMGSVESYTLVCLTPETVSSDQYANYLRYLKIDNNSTYTKKISGINWSNENKTVSWYGDDTDSQLNVQSRIYSYFVLG